MFIMLLRNREGAKRKFLFVTEESDGAHRYRSILPQTKVILI